MVRFYLERWLAFVFNNDKKKRHDSNTGQSGIEHATAYVFKLLSKLPKNLKDKHTQENEIIGNLTLALIMNVSSNMRLAASFY